MRIDDLDIDLVPLSGGARAFHADVDADRWRETCRRVHAAGGRLVALWGGDRRARGQGLCAHAALATRAGLVWLTHVASDAAYPAIDDLFASADRMQRAVHDLLGLRALGQTDTRAWLRHDAWPRDRYPLREDFDGSRDNTPESDEYRFVTVEGDGVHEIPVGPVHAGTIEPGHFRFSVIGERVLRLETRLGYTHKGVEKRFEGMTLADGARLAGRVSGDSTVAYAAAYAAAAEGAARATPPPRAHWLRALLLERERVANHLGDLGALGNDAGLAFGLAQFSRLKEEWLRMNAALFGHRYLMDAIVPGGVARDLDERGRVALADEIARLAPAVAALRDIYDDHPGLQDRFSGTGVVAPALAARLGLCGLAGRASAQAWDLRVQFPTVPYDELDVRMATQNAGDVGARVRVRFDELAESLRLCQAILRDLPAGAVFSALPDARAEAMGVGWVEGWRGEVLIALEIAGGRIAHLHPHDPSWHNWPLIEHAVIGNIVPDFPLINKSFNLSYSGHDL